MAFGLSESEITQIKAVFLSYPEIESVILFGSRALGTFKHNSDIDLALKGNFILNLVAKVQGVLNDELALPYMFDVVDYSKANPDLKAHINEFGRKFI